MLLSRHKIVHFVQIKPKKSFFEGVNKSLQKISMFWIIPNIEPRSMRVPFGKQDWHTNDVIIHGGSFIVKGRLT